MFHLQPLMFLGLFPLFAVFEGTWGHPPRGTSAQTSGLCSEPSTVVAVEVPEISDGGPNPGSAWSGGWTDLKPMGLEFRRINATEKSHVKHTRQY